GPPTAIGPRPSVRTSSAATSSTKSWGSRRQPRRFLFTTRSLGPPEGLDLLQFLFGELPRGLAGLDLFRFDVMLDRLHDLGIGERCDVARAREVGDAGDDAPHD